MKSTPGTTDKALEQESLEALFNNWDADQPVLQQINKDLYTRFGVKPDAKAVEYIAALRAEVAKNQSDLYKVTVRVMTRIADDVEALVKNVYADNWTQAAHFVASFTEFTTFAFKQ